MSKYAMRFVKSCSRCNAVASVSKASLLLALGWYAFWVHNIGYVIGPYPLERARVSDGSQMGPGIIQSSGGRYATV
jgi:hypothetical protein